MLTLKMMALKFVIFAGVLAATKCLELKNGAYEGLVVKIADNVPQEKCTQIIENLEVRLIKIFICAIFIFSTTLVELLTKQCTIGRKKRISFLSLLLTNCNFFSRKNLINILHKT